MNRPLEFAAYDEARAAKMGGAPAVLWGVRQPYKHTPTVKSTRAERRPVEPRYVRFDPAQLRAMVYATGLTATVIGKMLNWRDGTITRGIKRGSMRKGRYDELVELLEGMAVR